MLVIERIKTRQQGFSMAELLIVILIIAIIAVIALPQIMSSRRLMRYAGTQRQVVSVLREARQEAVSQRTAITMRYNDLDKTMSLSGGVFGAPGTANNRVFQLAGEGLSADDLTYGRPTGVSTAALGDATNLTALTSNSLEVTFRTDGSVVDGSNNPLNHALFFYDAQNPGQSAFAVSVLGAGGRAKIWKYASSVNAYVE